MGLACTTAMKRHVLRKVPRGGRTWRGKGLGKGKGWGKG